MQKGQRRFRIAVVKQLLIASVMLSIQMAVFFLSAGQIIGDLRPWIFFTASLLHYLVSIAVQYRLNPELLVQRLKMRREGSKRWDEILMRANNLTVVILIPLIAGLDVGRYLWSSLDAYFIVAGLTLLAANTVLLNWAMAVNLFFEPTVRIQVERGHRVVTSGPYKIVRHPGYLAALLYAMSIPLIIGSLYAFIPVGIYLILIVARTLMEDRTLQKELNGYSEYARRTRYRLFPWIW